MDIVIAGKKHIHYAKNIRLIASSAQVRGTGSLVVRLIYCQKIENKNAVIALDDILQGFATSRFGGIANICALRVDRSAEYRGKGLAKASKQKLLITLEKSIRCQSVWYHH